MHPMFTADGLFNKGRFRDTLMWSPPVKTTMPIDFKVKELDLFFNYQIDQCKLNDSIIGAVNNSDSEDSFFDNVNKEYSSIFINYVQDSN